MHSIEIRKLVLLLYQKGLSARATAYQVLHDCGKSVSPQTVARWARNSGISRPPGEYRSVELPSNLRQLYEDGTTSTELARRFGVSGSTILQRLRETGAKIRTGNSVFAHRMTRERLSGLWFRGGRSVKRIAEEYGCSLGTVYRLLKLHGLL